MTNCALKIRNLSASYKNPVFKDVSLEIQTGQFVTIMGENGAGKTTFFQTLLGTKPPSAGEILFWGKNREKLIGTELQKIGWVVSGQESYPALVSIKSYLTEISKHYPTWDHQLETNLLSRFELDSNKNLTHLSLGESSKIKLIRALCYRPELLILDELTANLSPKSKDVILESIVELFAQKSMAVLYITHFIDEAVRLSDNIFNLTANGLTKN